MCHLKLIFFAMVFRNKIYFLVNNHSLLRDCPQSRRGGGGGAGGGGGGGGFGGSRGPVKCYNCQEEGHMSRECPQGMCQCSNVLSLVEVKMG